MSDQDPIAASSTDATGEVPAAFGQADAAEKVATGGQQRDEKSVGATEPKSNDLGAKISDKATAENFQKESKEEREKRSDNDVASEQALDRLFNHVFNEIRTRVGKISGGHFPGGGVGNNIINISTVSPNSETPNPGSPSEASQPELPWPSSAFAACRDRVDDIAFLISAAVLDGRPIGMLRLASANLAKRLTSEIKLPADAPPPVPQLRSIDSLFDKFHIRISRERDEDGSGSSSERVRFFAPKESGDILLHSWSRLSGFPNWLDHLTGWLRELGSNEMQEVRVAAGAAAGVLWASGVQQIEKEIAELWYSDEKIRPLDALDACYTAAALADSGLREKIRNKLWAWGNITYGIDGVFALRHLSTRSYRLVDQDACFEGLEALLGKNNLQGLVHVQEAYERLFVISMDEPECSRGIAESLLRVLAKAKTKNDPTLRLQAIIVALSLIEVERRSKGQRFFVMDRVLIKAQEVTGLARLINAISAGSPMQASVMRILRDVFMRAVTNCHSATWTDSHVLKFFARIYEVGDEKERERLVYYIGDWSASAADKSVTAGLAARSLFDHMSQGVN